MLKYLVFSWWFERLAEGACDCDCEAEITGNSAVLKQSSHTHTYPRHFLIHTLTHTYAENQNMCGSRPSWNRKKSWLITSQKDQADQPIRNIYANESIHSLKNNLHWHWWSHGESSTSKEPFSFHKRFSGWEEVLWIFKMLFRQKNWGIVY